MSKARLVITAVTAEGLTQGEAARRYGVSQGWISKLMARYRAEGEAAFEPRSRRPKTSPTAASAEAVELIIRLRKELAGQGLDAGPQTIAWHLEHRHQVTVSAATVSRTLTRQGLVTPDPSKRPRSSYIRFAAELPNECWQSDFTHYPLAGGQDTEILTWIDDHSRYALSLTAHVRVTGPAVLVAFRAAAARHGPPASTLTDNGLVFTTRFAGGKGGRNALESELRRLPSTRTGTTSPPADHPAPNQNDPEPVEGSGSFRCLETPHGGAKGIRTPDLLHAMYVHGVRDGLAESDGERLASANDPSKSR
jgi:transposase InsO family protein